MKEEQNSIDSTKEGERENERQGEILLSNTPVSILIVSYFFFVFVNNAQLTLSV